MKAYFLLLTVLVLSAFLVIRNFDEARAAGGAPAACPMIAKLCPDGSSVSPEGPNCVIPACPDGGDAQIKSPTDDASPAADDCDGDDCGGKKTDENND